LVVNCTNRKNAPFFFSTRTGTGPQIPANRQLWIERNERVHRRLIHIAVQPGDREPVNWSGRQRVTKPPDQKPYLVVKQSVARKALLNVFSETASSRCVQWMSPASAG
jgi:hypothetical protein